MSKHVHNYGNHFNRVASEQKVEPKKVDWDATPYKDNSGGPPIEPGQNNKTTGDSNPPTEPRTGTVISRGKLNIRKTPSKDGELVCQVNPGDKLQIEEIENGWAHIYTSSGIEGYAMAEFVKEV